MQYLQMGKCTLCDKPAVGAINGNANAAALAPPRWEPRCDEHNPYWTPKPDLEGRIRELEAALREIAEHCRFSYAHATTIGKVRRVAESVLIADKRDKAE